MIAYARGVLYEGYVSLVHKMIPQDELGNDSASIPASQPSHRLLIAHQDRVVPLPQILYGS